MTYPIVSSGYSGSFSTTSSGLVDVPLSGLITNYSGGAVYAWYNFTAYTNTTGSVADFTVYIDGVARPTIKHKFESNTEKRAFTIPAGSAPYGADGSRSIKIQCATDSGELTVSGLQLYAFSDKDESGNQFLAKALTRTDAVVTSNTDLPVTSDIVNLTQNAHIAMISAGYTKQDVSAYITNYANVDGYWSGPNTLFRSIAYYEKFVDVAYMKPTASTSGFKGIATMIAADGGIIQSGIGFGGFYYTTDLGSSNVLPQTTTEDSTTTHTIGATETPLISGVITVNESSRLLVTYQHHNRKTGATFLGNMRMLVDGVETAKFQWNLPAAWEYDSFTFPVITDPVESGIHTVQIVSSNSAGSVTAQYTKQSISVMGLPYSVLSTNSTSHTLDGLLQKTSNTTHTLDALINKTSTVEHTTDSLLQKTSNTTHTLDALLLKTSTPEHTVDGYLLKGDTKTHTINALLQKQSSKTHTVDGQIARLKFHTIDALLYRPTVADNILSREASSPIDNSYLNSHINIIEREAS